MEDNRFDVVSLVGDLAERAAVAETKLAVILNLIKQSKRVAEKSEYEITPLIEVSVLEEVLGDV